MKLFESWTVLGLRSSPNFSFEARKNRKLMATMELPNIGDHIHSYIQIIGETASMSGKRSLSAQFQ